ncbi:SDR family NAD(P)-dependent oxidoreductase [Nocardia sp. NPDC057668]|uniref:SDR family NAD(P)-dependent oxidoreductase n=1 Tax=Nocardia sp. NPDC057668 TaxID=3346202 RepID=UPI00366EBDA9
MRALVTGGTDGIGREIAAGLSKSGVHVWITGRNVERGKAAAEALGATFLRAEHSTVAGNLHAAAELREEIPQLDILVNNVGGMAFPVRTVTPEGNEMIESLNYRGPITLTRALLPALAPTARVVQIVSSAAFMHRGDPFTEPARYSAIAAYARAKQLNLLASLSLTRVLTPGQILNAVNPGTAWTPGVQALTPATVPAWRFIWPLTRAVQRRRPPARAAAAPIALANADTTGVYYESNGRAAKLPQRLYDPALQDRAWEAAARW